MRTTKFSFTLAAALLFALGMFTGCESTDSGSTQVTSNVYYGVGFYDPWYHGDYDNDYNVVVTPPDRPGVAPGASDRAATRRVVTTAHCFAATVRPAHAVNSIHATRGAARWWWRRQGAVILFLMNETNHPLNMNLRPLVLCALTALLCSCATTSVKNTWKSPDSHQPVGKIAVLAIDDRGSVRRGFENRFVRQLEMSGSSATVTCDLLSLPQIKEDKRAAADRIRASGAEALLILRLVDVASSYKEVQAGGEQYAVMVTSAGSTGWFDYYSVGFTTMSPTYGNLKQSVYLETSLFDLNTDKRLWSGLTRTVLKEDMDRIAEMDPLVETIVAAMRKDGVVR